MPFVRACQALLAAFMLASLAGIKSSLQHSDRGLPSMNLHQNWRYVVVRLLEPLSTQIKFMVFATSLSLALGIWFGMRKQDRHQLMRKLLFSPQTGAASASKRTSPIS